MAREREGFSDQSECSATNNSISFSATCRGPVVVCARILNGALNGPEDLQFFIFNVTNGKLNCHLTQRSGDIALGIPFNLACYATLTQMIAQETNLELGEFSHYINDAHVYVNHIEGLNEQLNREPLELPRLKINKKPFWELTFDDFELINYQHHPIIKFPVAV